MLEQAQAVSYDLLSDAGSISVDGAGGAVKARNGFGKIDVRNAIKTTLDLATRNGTVAFAGSLGEGPHTLASDHDGIKLTLPGDTALTVDLKTNLGEIRSDFPVTLSGNLKSQWNGTINGGGARLTASTNSGSISLNISNP
jgi:DUF4097 and DUF4098 domain-containing protein YvlB